MKKAYQQLTFASWKLDMIDQVNSIITDYKEQGYNLTLRQVYYQFVSRDWLPQRWADKATGSTNNERSYKNLGELISTGRLGGMISWDAIVDRTRELTEQSHWADPENIIHNAARGYAIDKWADQDRRVEIWVEKDALEGVIARPADEYDVNYFSCRGYTSQTAMHDAAMRLKGYIKNDQDVIILHLGDHDPSGIDMTRDIQDRLNLFLGSYSSSLEVRRIALNKDQIDQYDPPPNPAKITDSRAAGYIEIHGTESWELDALEPSVINQLITDEIETIWNKPAFDRLKRREKEEQDQLIETSDRWAEVVDFLKG